MIYKYKCCLIYINIQLQWMDIWGWILINSYYQQSCKIQSKIYVLRHKIVNYMIVEKTKICVIIRNIEIPYKSVSNFKKQKRSHVWYFCWIWMHFCHQVLVIELQFFRYVKYVHSINQMRLFWFLNVKYFSIIFLKYILFYFIFDNQNKRIWLIEYTYFTYLKNCSSLTNTWL